MVYNRNSREPMSSGTIEPDRITFHVYKFSRNYCDDTDVAASLSDTLEELKVKILKGFNINCSPDAWRLFKYYEKSEKWTDVDNSNPFATIYRLGLAAFRTLSIERCSQQPAIEQSSQHLYLNNNTDLRLLLKLKNLSDTIPLTKSPMITLGQLRKEVRKDYGDSSKSQSIYLWKEDHWEKLVSNMDNKTLTDLKFVSGTLISLSIDEENIESKLPCGLTNLVNTCFMNSALQCLINIPEWTEQVLALTDTRKAPILNEYIKLITEMRSGKHQTIRPSSLFSNISDNLPRYSHYRQQDAQEFMNYFLHLIHQELQTCETLITNLFYGKIRSSVTCLGCNRTETTDESISFLPLPMSNDNRKTVLFVKADGELRRLSIKIKPSTVIVGDLINCFLEQNGVVVTQDLIHVVDLLENQFPYTLNSWNNIKYENEERLAFLERPTRTADDKYILCHFINRTTRQRFRPPVYVTCPKIQPRYTDLFDQIQQLCGHLCSATDASITACELYWIEDNKYPHPLSVETSKDESLAYISEFHIEMDTKWVDIYKDYCKNNNSKENSSLISLLDDFFREELLDGKYHCSTCPKSTQARQKSDLCLPLPKVLIIQLKRFTYDLYSNEKIDTFIPFPLHDLDLGQYVLKDNNNPNQNTSSTKYDLVAVSNHTGSLISGHYTAYAKSIQNQDHWYLFDDSYVRKLQSNNDVVTKNAYILVYVRKN